LHRDNICSRLIQLPLDVIVFELETRHSVSVLLHLKQHLMRHLLQMLLQSVSLLLTFGKQLLKPAGFLPCDLLRFEFLREGHHYSLQTFYLHLVLGLAGLHRVLVSD